MSHASSSHNPFHMMESRATIWMDGHVIPQACAAGSAVGPCPEAHTLHPLLQPLQLRGLQLLTHVLPGGSQMLCQQVGGLQLLMSVLPGTMQLLERVPQHLNVGGTSVGSLRGSRRMTPNLRTSWAFYNSARGLLWHVHKEALSFSIKFLL